MRISPFNRSGIGEGELQRHEAADRHAGKHAFPDAEVVEQRAAILDQIVQRVRRRLPGEHPAV